MKGKDVIIGVLIILCMIIPCSAYYTDSVNTQVLRTTNGNWASLHDTATGENHVAGTTCAVISGPTSNDWSEMRRGIAVFDTSDIADDQEITSGVLSIYPSGKTDTFGTGGSLVVVGYTGSETPGNDDYDNFGTEIYGEVLIADLTASAWNNITLTNLENINVTEKTKFGLRIKSDNDNSPPIWSASKVQQVAATVAPRLYVEYETYVPEIAFSLSITGKTNCTPTQFTISTDDASQFILKHYTWTLYDDEANPLQTGDQLSYSNTYNAYVNINTLGDYSFLPYITYLDTSYGELTNFSVTACNWSAVPLSNITVIPTPNFTAWNFTPVDFTAPTLSKDDILNATNASIIPNEWLNSVLTTWDNVLDPTVSAIEDVIDIFLFPFTFLSESLVNFEAQADGTFAGVQAFFEFWILAYHSLFLVIPAGIQLAMSFGLALCGVKIFLGWE